jgi:predicted phosphodiesterase
MQVDLLVYGGGSSNDGQQSTSGPVAYEYQGRLFINPGSLTGATSPVPSFALLDLPAEDGSSSSNAVITLYTYRLVGDEVKVDRQEFPRPPNPSVAE